MAIPERIIKYLGSLDDGRTVPEIAGALQVSPGSIYNKIKLLYDTGQLLRTSTYPQKYYLPGQIPSLESAPADMQYDPAITKKVMDAIGNPDNYTGKYILDLVSAHGAEKACTLLHHYAEVAKKLA